MAGLATFALPLTFCYCAAGSPRRRQEVILVLTSTSAPLWEDTVILQPQRDKFFPACLCQCLRLETYLIVMDASQSQGLGL